MRIAVDLRGTITAVLGKIGVGVPLPGVLPYLCSRPSGRSGSQDLAGSWLCRERKAEAISGAWCPVGTLSQPSSDHDRIAMSNAVASYLHFMGAALVKLRQTGAIVPSQRFLIGKMLAPIPETYAGQILELGAGSGALTVRLAARCPRARILACEINPALARATRHNLDLAGINGRVEVISDSAQHVISEMSRRGKGKVDYVLSGIPLGALPGERAQSLIDAISRVINPGGMYIQFQYSLIDRKRVRSRFKILRTVPVLLNFPPAVVYYAQR